MVPPNNSGPKETRKTQLHSTWSLQIHSTARHHWKLVSSCVAGNLVLMLEKHQLLPDNMDADQEELPLMLFTIVFKQSRTHREGNDIGVAFLNIKGSFLH